MIRHTLIIGLAWTVVGSAALAQPASERLFYYTDTEESYNSFVRNADRITVLAPSVYRLDSLGIIWGDVDQRVLDLAKQKGVKVMPLIVNEAFHQPGLRRFLSDSSARTRAIRSMLELCRTRGFWGVQIDIENLNVQDAERFTSFYSDAARALHAARLKLSIAVVHRPSELPGTQAYHRFLFDSWRGGYDLGALAKAGDFISVMTYSQHTRRTPPGPQAGLPWTREVIDYFLKFMPPEKLSLGVATQGLHWFTREDNTLPERARSWAETVTWTWGSGMAQRHGATLQWDPVQGTTWGYFESGGTFEWLFLEDVRSFGAKLALAKEKRLRGISVWVLGTEDERIWSPLGETARR
ncbi:MAG: glycosyl hydrolase family 18 protein [Gemmatimonadaceae bacterium]